ncbi:MAG: MerR family transcriptional regulator, partial [Flavobacteriaceae bacterium]
MSEKAPEAFRTISEVADLLDIPQHVLRFWETRFSQIKPLKRGGGRRYYRPEDVDLLRGIRHLLYGEGYTIKGVQRILKDQGLRYVATIWQEGATPVPAPAAVQPH